MAIMEVSIIMSLYQKTITRQLTELDGDLRLLPLYLQQAELSTALRLTQQTSLQEIL